MKAPWNWQEPWSSLSAVAFGAIIMGIFILIVVWFNI
jgi:hypothetical protein